MGFEITGKLHAKYDLQQITERFSKREFVVEAMDGQYSQQIKFEAVKDNTSLTDGLQKGDKVKGQVKSITDFGVFIGLPGGIDGLVHLSDLSWNEQGEITSTQRYQLEIDLK